MQLQICEQLSLADCESANLFYKFVTLLSLIYDKKLNFQTVFLLMLQHEEITKLCMEITDIDNKYELYKLILTLEPSIIKSKIIARYINNGNK